MISVFNKYERLAAYAEELEKDNQPEKAQKVRNILIAELNDKNII